MSDRNPVSEKRKEFYKRVLNKIPLRNDGLAHFGPTLKGIPFSRKGMAHLAHRGAASFGSSKDDKIEILKKQGLQAFDLQEVDAGEGIGVFDEGYIYAFDPEGFELGDALDFAGDIPPTVLSALGGAKGFPFGPKAMMTTAGIGGGIGEGIRQTAGKALGAKGGYDLGNVALETALGVIGEVPGKALRFGADKIMAPFKDTVSRGVGDLQAKAKVFDERYGTNLAEKLPLSSIQESDVIAGAEARVRELPITRGVYEERVEIPLTKEKETVLSRIGKKYGMEQPAGGKVRQETGQVVSDAAEETLDRRIDQIETLYSALGEFVAPATPIIPSESKEVAQAIFERVSADKSGVFKGKVNMVAGWLDAVENLKTFSELDAFRKNVGEQLNTNMGREMFAVRGLDAQVRKLYGALRRDVQHFYDAGGVASEEAISLAQDRAQKEIAEEAASLRARQETITLQEALQRLGPLSTRGLTPGEMPGEVGASLRRMEKAATKKGKLLTEVDLMANKLGEEYPELEIFDLKDLKEALRLETALTKKVDLDVPDNVSRDLASRPIGLGDAPGYDLNRLEEGVTNATDMDNLRSAMSRVEQAFDAGEISKFEKNRLSNLGNNMAAVHGDSAAKKKQLQLGEEAEELQRQKDVLGETVGKKGKETLGAFEAFMKVEESSSVGAIFKDAEKQAGIADKLRGLELDQIRQIKRKYGGEGYNVFEATKEGLAANDKIKRFIFNDLLDKTQIKGRDENVNSDLVFRSGQAILRKMDKYKEGVLEELIGTDATRELREFAELIKSIQLRQQKFGNPSGTASANYLLSLFSKFGRIFTSGNPITFASLMGDIVGAKKALQAVTMNPPPLPDRTLWPRPASIINKKWLSEGYEQTPDTKTVLGIMGQAGTRGASSLLTDDEE